MSATILDGISIREQIAEQLNKKVQDFGLHPSLVIIQVGDNPESNSYIRQKKAFAEKAGIAIDHRRYPVDVTQADLLETIEMLNADPATHGILIQLPLPAHLNKDELIEAISPIKDSDGLHSKNVTALWSESTDGHIAATAKAVMTLCDAYSIQLEGKHVVVIGQSTLVGKPIAMSMLKRKATVTVCNRFTKDLKPYTTTADVIIVAAGKPKLITKDHVKPGQVVIDVGITVQKEEIDGKRYKKLYGDVDFDEVKEIVHAISPVPGGVGPLTVASLFENVVDAAIKMLK